jgi:hypothetical protein
VAAVPSGTNMDSTISFSNKNKKYINRTVDNVQKHKIFYYVTDDEISCRILTGFTLVLYDFRERSSFIEWPYVEVCNAVFNVATCRDMKEFPANDLLSDCVTILWALSDIACAVEEVLGFQRKFTKGVFHEQWTKTGRQLIATDDGLRCP